MPDDSNDPGQNILLYDLCVPAGSSVELMAQATLEYEVEEVCLTFYLDGEKVAEGCSDDSSEPSSMSCFFKGTVADDTLVELKIGNDDEDDILPFNLQFGAKVFDDCYVGVVNTIPEAF